MVAHGGEPKIHHSIAGNVRWPKKYMNMRRTREHTNGINYKTQQRGKQEEEEEELELDCGVRPVVLQAAQQHRERDSEKDWGDFWEGKEAVSEKRVRDVGVLADLGVDGGAKPRDGNEGVTTNGENQGQRRAVKMVTEAEGTVAAGASPMQRSRGGRGMTYERSR
ncbi:hypothetical protein PIB30_077290 [Stylosanthes scabra]|uniref:Uncharacterized protein n=1 Tax=Stylosanthes scabra TaxID=79078 RepID=A0ABU6RQS9_9FABA|nr:hypothetical protein [Stylosanthes scabra]